MKKIFFSILTLLSATSAHALPLGNPSEASLLTDGVFTEGRCVEFCDPEVCLWDAWSIRIGFYGDYVFDRHLEAKDYEIHPSLRKTEIVTNAGFLAVNFYDRFDIFTTLGATWLNFTGTEGSFTPTTGTPFQVDKVYSETNFSWSIGVRGTIWECGCLAIGAEGQYFRTRPYINAVDEGATTTYPHKRKIKYEEWQVGVGASYRINIASCSTALVPYLGIDWSDVYLDLPYGTLNKYHADRGIGYALGLTLVGCNKIAATVEGRFINETALYLNVQFRL